MQSSFPAIVLVRRRVRVSGGDSRIKKVGGHCEVKGEVGGPT